MNYDSFAKHKTNPPRGGGERRIYNESFPARNNDLEEIELGRDDYGLQMEGQTGEGGSFESTFALKDFRRNFIKKLYGIVGLELLLVTFIMVLFIFTPLKYTVYKTSAGLINMIISSLISVAIVITLVCCPVDKVLRKWPLNIILAFLKVSAWVSSPHTTSRSPS